MTARNESKRVDRIGRRSALVIGFVVVLTAQMLLGISGSALFANAESDALRPVDAIVVLGGEHDGREAYGVELAQSGLAPVVVLSDPYESDDEVMAEMCGGDHGTVTVICAAPDPSTTRGEAIMAKRLAAEHGWSSIVVISWRYHLPRARHIFAQCFSSEPGAVLVKAVPRSYDFSVVHWQYTFLYQYAGFAKAEVQGSCS